MIPAIRIFNQISLIRRHIGRCIDSGRNRFDCIGI